MEVSPKMLLNVGIVMDTTLPNKTPELWNCISYNGKSYYHKLPQTKIFEFYFFFLMIIEFEQRVIISFYI